MVRRMLPITLAVALVALGTPAADKLTLKSANVDLPAGDRMFPDGPGAGVGNDNCLACHSAGMVLNQPALPKAIWEAEVDKMRKVYKAPIDDKDVDAIVHYLISIKGAN
jgi:mono/diheme cytochrome c family protein